MYLTSYLNDLSPDLVTKPRRHHTAVTPINRLFLHKKVGVHFRPMTSTFFPSQVQFCMNQSLHMIGLLSQHNYALCVMFFDLLKDQQLSSHPARHATCWSGVKGNEVDQSCFKSFTGLRSGSLKYAPSMGYCIYGQVRKAMAKAYP